MQTTNFKRILAVLMTVVMLLTAIPFAATAADETTTKDYYVFGSYNGTPLVWEVLGYEADGTVKLISKDVIAKTKFGGKDFATATIYTTLNTDFYGAAFSEAEKAYMSEFTVSYNSASATGKVLLPTYADYTAGLLTYAVLLGTTTKTVYWLADLKTGIQIYTVNAGGASAAAANTTQQGYRPVICVDLAAFATLNPTENAAYTTTAGTEITAAGIGSQFKVVLAENYTDSAITVRAGSTAMEAADGVYTVTAGGTIYVDGVTANAADYTAYNEAVASAAGLDGEFYTEETWAALEAALAADVANLTFADQAKVDEAAAAIAAAVKALVLAPADFEAYNAALAVAQDMLARKDYFDLTQSISAEIDPLQLQNYEYYLNQVTKASNVNKILALTKADQATVDAEAEYINKITAGVTLRPANLTAWNKAVATRSQIDMTYFDNDYVAAVWAAIDAEVETYNYAENTPTIDKQAEVDASTQRMLDAIGNIDDYRILADFSMLKITLELAAAYAEENYYKDDDEAIRHPDEEGGTAAWDQFAAMKAAAETVLANEANAPTKKAYQKTIDDAVLNLANAMANLDAFIRLGKWDRFVKDVKYFFSDIVYTIQGIIDLLKTVGGLLKMLINGEISLYEILELVGVDQEILDTLEKIGITPPETPEETPVE